MKITVAVPVESAATAVADALAMTGQHTPLLPVDLIALALVTWSERELTNLVTGAAADVAAGTARGRRLVDRLDLVRQLADDLPLLRSLRARRKAARALALRWNVDVQGWMLWELWQERIGCDTCQKFGPAAPCWGAYGCHGFASGCGCIDCVTYRRILEIKRKQTEDEHHGN
jgi:hypothetical protein